jgi:biotin carboxyl carrier protein
MILREVSLLLEQFQQSEWQDMYVRTSRYSLFVAKLTGGPNPMRSAGAETSAPPDEQSENMIVAPHVGSVTWLAQVNSVVEPGSVVARIEVLGESIEIVSERGGHVKAVLSAAGTLIEYETPLLIIVPRI